MIDVQAKLVPPRGTNWGYLADPELDSRFQAIRASFDPAAQLEAIRRTHERFVDEAMFLGGLDKGAFLREFEPDFFFDDQTGHVTSAAQHVPAGHVASGVANP